jgi:hypothetical protein
MKNTLLFSFLLVIVSTSLFTGCTKDSNSYGDTTREAITKAQWSVDYFFAGQDKTAQFSGYAFSFVGNGMVTATDGVNSFNGNWSMITDAHRNDVLRINISEAHMQDLNSEWIVSLMSDGALTMKGAVSEIHLKKL